MLVIPLALVLMVVWPASAMAQRVALVIGNHQYAHTTQLPQAARDARLVKSALTEVGFEVLHVDDTNRTALMMAIRRFSERLPGAEVGVVYYAGHAIEVEGINYAVPVDARLSAPHDVDIEAVSLNWVLEEMGSAGSELNVVFLDACRDNPFARSWRGSDRRFGGRGLKRFLRVPPKFVIGFATDPGNVAEDSGVYARSLVRHIRTPCRDLDAVLREVHTDVVAATRHRQRPWVNDAAGWVPREFYPAGCDAPSTRTPTRPKPLWHSADQAGKPLVQVFRHTSADRHDRGPQLAEGRYCVEGGPESNLRIDRVDFRHDGPFCGWNYSQRGSHTGDTRIESDGCFKWFRKWDGKPCTEIYEAHYSVREVR